MRFVVLSILVHAALAIGGRMVMPTSLPDAPDRLAPIAFELVTSELKAPAEAVGLGTDGPEPERTTGLPSGPSRGRAGDPVQGSAPAIHLRGADPRDRFASGADAARALTGVLAEGLREATDGRSPFDATGALGARDESSLGVRGSSMVAPGERGLDMIGTGHGGCASEDCAAGTVSGTLLGPGALGGRTTRLASLLSGGPHVRTLCITDDACGQRRGIHARLRVAVEVLGALEDEPARRVIARRRGAIGHCLERDETGSESLELFVTPGGSVARASSGSECLAAMGAAITFPAAPGPSIVTVRASVSPSW